jgi:phospholipid/cholesterol/gamma-HCH transport system substrate-binding protein
MRIPLPGSRRSARSRLAAALVLVTAAAAGGAAVSGSEAADRYRVDAIFDSAKGIIPGNAVKIAGARVGTVKKVVLEADVQRRIYKARIQMSIEGRFAPFRTNAHCDLQSEALIGERFVQCEPGNAAGGRDLQPSGGHAPTVPVQHTFVPVSFTDLFNIFRTPVRQRFGIVIASLGLGFAGRGDDFNDVLRRSNPTLALIRRTVTTLNRQRDQLKAAIVYGDQVSDSLARRSQRVADFIDRTGRVARQTGQHDRALAEGIRRLPALLDAARPALRRLDGFTAATSPVLTDLRGAAPRLERLVGKLRPFARVARPALSDLGSALVTARPLVKRLTPRFQQLGAFAEKALPTGQALAAFLTNARDRGVVEGYLQFFYSIGELASRYDAVSHLSPINLLVNNCGTSYAFVEVPGCSARWSPGLTATPRSRSGSARPQARRPDVRRGDGDAPTPTTTPAAPARPRPPSIRVPGLPPIQLPSVPDLRGGNGAPGRDPQSSARKLLDYLLG